MKKSFKNKKKFIDPCSVIFDDPLIFLIGSENKMIFGPKVNVNFGNSHIFVSTLFGDKNDLFFTMVQQVKEYLDHLYAKKNLPVHKDKKRNSHNKKKISGTSNSHSRSRKLKRARNSKNKS